MSPDDPQWLEALEQAKAQTEADRGLVLEKGGLHIVGTERHEARRIDNQLRGRAGRQGGPGSSRFFISLEDDLMRRFGGQSVAGIMDRLGMDENMPIENSVISRAIENAQVRVEGYNFDIRKHVLEYDDVVNKQREVIYEQRLQILSEPSMRPTIWGMIEDEIEALFEQFVGNLDRSEWDLAALHAELNKIIPLEPAEKAEAWWELNADELRDRLLALAEDEYDRREAELGEENMRRLERLVMLQIVDGRWMRHLTDLDELREGIGLRAFAQQDPLISYKKEAHEMYQALLATISHDLVYAIFHVQLMVQPPTPQPQRMQTNRGDGEKAQPVRSAKGNLGRNDPCWCGSGKKYKNCHLRSDHGQGRRRSGQEHR
jgi:preprotein translocase subunit SecA